MVKNMEKIYKRRNILDLFDEPEDFMEDFDEDFDDIEYEELEQYGVYDYWGILILINLKHEGYGWEV